MATKKKEVSEAWRGFYNYHLSEEEKAGIRQLLSSNKGPELGACILELAKNDYKVTFSRNGSNDTFICTATGKAGSLNRGYSYSLTHVDLRVAIIGLWFVVGDIHGWGEWPVERESVPDW